MTPKEKAVLTAGVRAIGNPVRREILRRLKDPAKQFARNEMTIPNEEGVCVARIAEGMGLAQSTVSAHLRLLQKAGLVASMSVGKWTYFRRLDAGVAELLGALHKGL